MNTSDQAKPAKPGGLLYLEDLHVGRRFRSASQTVDAQQIKAFAAEFDAQPFHLDDEAARGTLFRGLAASGWHTAAITMRLLGTSELPFAGGILGSRSRVASTKSMPSTFETNRKVIRALAVMPQRLVRHHRSEV